MNKTFLLSLCLTLFSFTLYAQTLGEKSKLPEGLGQLQTDGVYHLPLSLLTDSKVSVEAYFRFFPDDTFIVLHSRVSPETNPEYFQANCNYEFISTGTAPFNKDYKLKSKENIARARIPYEDKFILLEFDIRLNVIQATLKTFSPSGERIGEPAVYVMPFQQISWPVVKTVIKKE